MRPLETDARQDTESGHEAETPPAAPRAGPKLLGWALTLGGVVGLASWIAAHPEPMQVVSDTFSEMRRAFAGPGSS
ncbi:hypothetical protein DLJ49_09055 [Rhodovulum sp. 12E13]|uniref:hypothetical protein n=1 Tax=Rhodovulum sp. 12E13 TaxID=2203891 RepID=UPI000E1B519F|nr:hypothetical protein [Rhodovulum sp. 12E13]RDC72763.1 hypothetical protein DLJ49_09055 [Rhodovulum sp. 12E13]